MTLEAAITEMGRAVVDLAATLPDDTADEIRTIWTDLLMALYREAGRG